MERSFGRIQFGPGSVIYLMVCTLVLFAAVYTQANLLFWALGLVIGALVVSVVFTWLSLRGIEVHRLAPSRGVAGEPLVLRYDVVNRSRFACFSMEIIETWGGRFRGWRREGPLAQDMPRLKGRPFGWVLHIGPGQTIQAEAPCWPLRRGPLRFEQVIVRTGFPFGIIRKSIVFQQPGEALIYPPLRRLSRQAALSLSGTDVRNARHSDRSGGMDEFFGLRPYRPGDNYKLIDWKHSAKVSRLVSREMTQPRPPRMMILLDLRLPDHSDTNPQREPVDKNLWTACQEEAINLAGSLIREAFLHNLHVGLAIAGAAGNAIPMYHSKSHRQRLLDTLAMIEFDPTQNQHTPAPPTVLVRPTVRHPADNQSLPDAMFQPIQRQGQMNLDWEQAVRAQAKRPKPTGPPAQATQASNQN